MTRLDKVDCGKCFDRGYTCVAVSGTENLSDFDYAYCLDYEEEYCHCSRGTELKRKDGVIE